MNGVADPADPDLRVGIISDTHGLLRPEARAFLIGCDYIVHGGDIGAADILEELRDIAPLIVVKGNNDTQAWASELRETELVRIGKIFICVIHNLADLAGQAESAPVRVVVSGHSHRPAIIEREGVLFFNPGSCGPRRFNLPIAAGELRLNGTEVQARIVKLCE